LPTAHPITVKARARNERIVITAVSLQLAVTVVLTLVAGVAVGSSSAWSLFLGGAAAFIPNALFALRLSLHRGKSPESYPVVFFLGEFAKIGLTIAILAAIVNSYDSMHGLSLLIGLIASLKAPLFALWLTGDRTRYLDNTSVKPESH
jgi:ATP synthase protein I